MCVCVCVQKVTHLYYFFTADVLNTVLTIYLYPLDGDQPLPGPDEVLLCTNTTTHDQVPLMCIYILYTLLDPLEKIA